MEDRYDKYHYYGKVKFYLSNNTPDVEQSRMLMLKTLEQAVRDYCSLVSSTNSTEQATWMSAKLFLFDPNYEFAWGGYNLTLEGFLDILDIDVDWFREQTIKKFENG